jgi:hypothetical protein
MSKVLSEEEYQTEWAKLTRREVAKVQEHMELSQLSAKLVLSQYPHLRHQEGAAPAPTVVKGPDPLLTVKKGGSPKPPWKK